MALTRSTARRYAEAAFEIAERDDSMEAWTAAFAMAEERLTSAEVIRLLSNPAVPVAARADVLGRLVGDEVVGAPRNLMALLIRRGRFDQLPGVIREFRRLYRRREGIVEATVVSSISLDDQALASLQTRLAEMTGSRIELSTAVDPALLGGVQVRVGDRLIDGSVRGRLERLRAEFSTITI